VTIAALILSCIAIAAILWTLLVTQRRTARSLAMLTGQYVPYLWGDVRRCWRWITRLRNPL
jgi:hypothetical protein